MSTVDKPSFEDILIHWKVEHDGALIPVKCGERLESMKRLMVTLKNYGYDESVINNFHTNLIIRESTPASHKIPQKLKVWQELARASVLQAKAAVWPTVNMATDEQVEASCQTRTIEAKPSGSHNSGPEKSYPPKMTFFTQEELDASPAVEATYDPGMRALMGYTDE